MDDLVTAVKCSNRIEQLLKQHYHAHGNSLSEVIDSCSERLPREVHDKLHEIAYIHSEALAKGRYEPADSEQFFIVCKQCEKELQPRSSKLIWRFVVFIILTVTAMAVWFYAINWHYINDL